MLAAVALSLGGLASADVLCTPGPNWTQTATDALGQTTYAVSAPPCVFVGVPFDVVLTVTDGTWPDADVGAGWALLDNGDVIAGGGFNWITTVGGIWQQTVTQTYTVMVADHAIQFQFTDLGNGAGAHFWSGRLIGGVTVDPAPPSVPPPPEPTPIDPPAAPGPAPVAEPDGGCASGGGEAGSLALLAAMGAAWRSRRCAPRPG